MAQYTMNIKIQSGTVNKTVKKGFFAKDAETAIEFGQRQVDSQQEYYDRAAPGFFTVKFQSLKRWNPGRMA